MVQGIKGPCLVSIAYKLLRYFTVVRRLSMESDLKLKWYLGDTDQ